MSTDVGGDEPMNRLDDVAFGFANEEIEAFMAWLASEDLSGEQVKCADNSLFPCSNDVDAFRWSDDIPIDFTTSPATLPSSTNLVGREQTKCMSQEEVAEASSSSTNLVGGDQIKNTNTAY